MSRVGIIEDNADFRTEVEFHLRRAGFEIVLVGNGLEFDAKLAANPCDLLVLDLNLPGEDGLSIARRLRATRPGIGIVMLTARSALQDRLDGLDQGADAYLTKPVNMQELVAVLNSLARRLANPAELTPAEGCWVLDVRGFRLSAPDGQMVALTTNERDLMLALAAAGGRPVSRGALAAAIGHPEPDYDERRIEVAFSRLRLKLEDVSPGNQPVRAARGRGYTFAAPIRFNSN